MAQPASQTVDYSSGDTKLEGFLVLPPGSDAKKSPGVLIVHDWTGLQDYAKERAEKIAQLGYVAFAADIYGKGIRPTTPADSGKEAGKYKSNPALFRERLAAGLAELKKHCHPEKTAAIGYCFGGSGVLELARSGADVRGVVSFHGGLGTPKPAESGDLRAKILVCHGADDPHVPTAEREAFENEMRSAKADWTLVAYGGAVHSFTKKAAGSNTASGNAFQAEADARSWEHMKLFFSEIFR